MNSPHASRSADGPDPELLELPPPRRPFRTVTLISLGVTAIAALGMLWGLSADVGFALSRQTLRDVGRLGALQPRAELRNSWVRGEGELAAVGGIRFERPLESDSFRLAPLQDNPKLWVQVRVPSGYEDEHFVAPTVFSGRLVPRSALGLRFSTLATAPEAAGWQPGHLPKDAWILIDGESPRATRWVLGLVVLFAGFAGFALWALRSLLRPVSSASAT